MNDLKINIPTAPTTPVMPAMSATPAMPAMPATPAMPAAAPATPATPATPAMPAATPLPAVAVPELDLDSLLSKIQEVKPTVSGTRKSSVLVVNTSEGIKSLVEKATTAGIDRLPWSTVIRQTAIALGIVDKKSQYYYTLGQSVLKVLGNSIRIYKEGRKTFIACAGVVPITADPVEEVASENVTPEPPVGQAEISAPVQA